MKTAVQQNKNLNSIKWILIGMFCTAFSTPGFAQFSNPMTGGENKAGPVSGETPRELEDVKIEEKLGSTLPLNLAFTDETGKKVLLGDYFNQGKPVLISLVYFKCPGLCNYHLNGLTEALTAMDWTVGEKFTALAISFDSNDKPEDAVTKKDLYMKSYGRPEAASGWHFLTADEETVQAFTSSVGFKFKWNDDVKEWSHGSTAIIANASGLLTRYLPGIVFEPRDLKLALNESALGKIGNFVESMVLYCFKYNSHQGRYTVEVFNVLKLAALTTILLLLFWMIPFWLRQRRVEPSVRSAS
ncbi:MAG: SCO family protein [Pseudobdellovibrionaceae bacterium]